MKVPSCLLVFRVVLWKNYIIRCRHWLLTIFELVIPVALFLFLSYARSKVPDFSRQYVNETTTIDRIYADEIYTRLNIHDLHILYTPKTDFTKALIRKVQLKLQVYNEGIHDFTSRNELEAFYDKIDGNVVTAAVIFSDVGNSLPEKLNYDIRIYEQHVFWNTEHLFQHTGQYVPGLGSETYIDKGFLPLQMAIDTSFIELVTKNSQAFSLSFQEFPYPPYVKVSGLKFLIIHTLPILMLFSFLFLWPSILKRVIEEKCSGIKELMKINGLDSWMLWASWFLNGFLLNMVSIIVIVLILKLNLWDVLYPPVQYCHGVLLFIYLTLFCTASISFCLAFSTQFNKPTMAMIVAILLWIISYLVFNGVAENIDILNWPLKLPFLLMPNIALYYGFNVIYAFEEREVHLNFSNMFESPTGSSNDITMGCLLAMLIFDTVIYFVLTLYLDKVFPGPYGVRKSWLFPLKNVKCQFKRNSIMHGKSSAVPNGVQNVGKSQELKNNAAQSSENAAIEKSNLPPKIKIRQLQKTYDNKSVLDNLTLDIYTGQITGLLGHNGAGKTTTMSILTGMISATSGRVLYIVDKGVELDIQEDFDRIRHLLSICPQHNLMFMDLTVLEHLIFFGMLRGLSRSAAEKEAKLLLENKLRLSDKKNKLVSTLSGGMKRKLSLGMALMGNPEILVLDEPTSGVDIESRRELWDLILSYKHSKTIIITTHFLEEADVLADRIAIMDHGNLLCYGTPLYLKNIYDVGYHLTLSCEKVEDEAVNEKIKVIDGYIKEMGARRKFECGSSIKYHLPNDQKHRFPELLSTLEKEKAEMRRLKNSDVFSFGISNTTLEDVYLKVGDLAADSREDKGSQESLKSKSKDMSQWETFKKIVRALCKKRQIYMKKKFILYLFMMFLSFLIIAMVFYLGGSGSVDVTKDGPTLNLDLGVYGETGVYYSASGRNSEKVQKYYEELVQNQHGVPKKVDDVQEAIIQKGIDNIAYYKLRMIVSAEFSLTNENKEINVLYSNNALHGAPISLNLIMNTLLKVSAGDQYAISASNTPLHSQDSKTTVLHQSEVTNALVWFILFPLAPLFVVVSGLSFIHAEESSGIRKLQSICGVQPWLYWTFNLLWDISFYILAMALCMFLLVGWAFILSLGSFYPFGNLLLFESHDFGAIAIILLIYTCSVPSVYWVSYLNKTVESAYALYLLLNISIFPLLTVCVTVMEMSGINYYEQLASTLRYVFAIFPQFTLTYMSAKFSNKFIQNHNWEIKTESEKKIMCSYGETNPCCVPNSFECASHKSYFYYDFLYIYSTVGVAAALFILLIFVGPVSAAIRRFSYSIFSNKDTKTENDEDVSQHPREEHQAVLQVRKIKQIYISLPKFWNWVEVIKNISFVVKKGECFGLLGVNGAGKSTSFRMMAKEEYPIEGEIIRPCDKKLATNSDCLGYCPQQDALINELTGRELLEIFAVLRGVDNTEVQKLLTLLDLQKYADQPCGTYSGGNKRKLNTCLSLIGLPYLIMLDEPTSGVDPASRRTLWDVISNIKAMKTSGLVLSSHSMDECAFLCDELAIIKEGKVVHRGTISELQEIGKRYTIKIKLTNSSEVIANSDTVDFENENTRLMHRTDSPEVELQLKEKNPQELLVEELSNKFSHKLQILDEHSGFIHGRVQDITWTELFTCLEELKAGNNSVEDYTVSETSLEELFLQVARKEREESSQTNLKNSLRKRRSKTCTRDLPV